ncbi:protochlorophyllide-dependent translocon component 52, putative [Medicago truncatula]|uniref:Protochlorophyllide-dependent translocon component 52, putative n=1 Tax=Medicago truncatula TaxID=3880 RepID=G7LIM4_MEDTR|nr:protochlorophyllide-dependent translocon component 52, putative [Medicago truncatula]
MDVGQANWHKACFCQQRLVIGFRKCLKKYAGGEVEWRGKYDGALPLAPPREQLMDRNFNLVDSSVVGSLAYLGFFNLVDSSVVGSRTL